MSRILTLTTLLALALRPALALPLPPTAAAPTLEFIENKGQWDARAQYVAPLPAGQLLLGAHGFSYVLADAAALAHHHPGRGEAGAARPEKLAQHAYNVEFVDCRAGLRAEASGPTGEVRNYFVGADPARWAGGVGSFRRLRYPAVWPGTAVQVYESAARHLEYDLELAPRANPARIRLRYTGADGLRLDAAGNLLIGTSVGTVTEQAPQAWQLDAAGQRQPVPCRFVLKENELSFALGAYDRRRALTIDPTVLFSSSTGATADNWGFTATYDAQGNLYSGGIVFNYSFGTGNPAAGSFPATPGAFSSSFASVMDMALIKFNPAVSGPAARVWATYLGGNSSDFPHSLVVNGQGELLVLGSTSSTNYPTTAGALGRAFGGGAALDPFRDGAPYDLPNGADLVLTRFSANAGRLAASTYLGGSANDGVQELQVQGLNAVPLQLVRNYGDNFRSDVLLDGAGNVYVASNTASANFPGARRTYGGGASDAVVCILPPALSSVTTALLGGSGADAAYSLQRDPAGRIFVAGGTTSPNFPTTPGALQPAPAGGVDGFALRLDPTGAVLEKSTYLGTAAYDQSYFVQLDGLGNPYLLGQTLGRPPISPGRYNVVGGGLQVQRLDPDLGARVFSTTFGASAGADLVPTAFLVDECERVYICGWGGTVNQQVYTIRNGNDTTTGGPLFLGGSTFGLPVTPGAVQATTDGSDFYLAEFDPGMTGLDYATFLGQNGGSSGEHVDGGTSRFDRRGVVYQAVCGGCGGSRVGFPVPPGANTYSATNNSSNCNNAAFKLDFDRNYANAGPRRFVCATNGPVALAGSPAGGTWTGPGVQPAPGGGYRFAPAVAGPGAHRLTYTVASTGSCITTQTVRWVVAAPAAATLAAVPAQCTTNPPVLLRGNPAGGSFSGPGVTGPAFNPAQAGAGLHTLTYTLCDSVGGDAVVTQQVRVVPPVAVVAGADTVLCADQLAPFQLRGQSPAGGTWSGPHVSPAGVFTPPNTAQRGGIYRLTYTLNVPPCTSSATRQVLLAPVSSADVPLNLPVCPAAPQYAGLAPLSVALAPLLPGGTYRWDFGDGSPVSTLENPSHRYERPGSYRIRLEARYAGCQVVTGFAPLEVAEVFVPNIITPNANAAAGDSLNETFRPRFSCRPASLKIFSRWGQEVYRTDHYRNDWNAAGLANGHYFYLLKDDEGRTQKGWVEVKR